jgi:hypothetical protein
MRALVRSSTLALLVILAACSDSATAPGTQSADLNAVLSEMSLPAVSAATTTLADIPLPAATGIVASSCAFAPSSQSFVCPTVTAAGLVINQSFALLSGSNAAQSAFDAATTAAVRTHTTVAGTVADPARSASTLAVDAVQDMTLSGLLTGTHVLDGVSTTHLAGSGTFTSTTVVTTSSLVLPASTTGSNSWPKSGSITIDETADAGFVLPATTRITVVFNGTSVVDVTIGGGFLSHHCRLDLAQKPPVCQ